MHEKSIGATLLTVAALFLGLFATASAQAGADVALDSHFKTVPVAGEFPFNDPRWSRRLYGWPYPGYLTRTICGWERMPFGVGKKIVWRRVYRCH
jgi:hypothetical protein